jgi:hypothetical protein
MHVTSHNVSYATFADNRLSANSHICLAHECSAPVLAIGECGIFIFCSKMAFEPPLKGRKLPLFEKHEQKRSISVPIPTK